jgi:hypothetical protein
MQRFAIQTCNARSSARWLATAPTPPWMVGLADCILSDNATRFLDSEADGVWASANVAAAIDQRNKDLARVLPT